MKKQLVLAAAVALALSSAAQATVFGDTTNNNQTYNQGGTGGQGGKGGEGGTGVGVGVGVGVGIGQGGNASAEGGKGGAGGNGYGGSVVGSGNSNNSNRNDNKNTNLQGQQQGQAQSNRSTNTNANLNNSSASASNAGNNSNTQVSVGGDTYNAPRIPVATAYAPNIVATALCKFGVSGGGQGMTFGFSVGVSITDENCMLLEQVRTVSVVLGQKEVAQEMMMAVPAYAEAVKRLKGGGTSAPAAALPQSTGAGVAAVGYNENDPIIRARLGLPPLSAR